MPDPAPLIIIQPNEAASNWQPVPANGFVRCLLESGAIGAQMPFAVGTQTLDGGCFVQEHLHPANEEVILVLEGSGEALLDGVRTEPLTQGTFQLVGKGRPRRFEAAAEAPMTFLWLMLPVGLRLT